MPIFLWSTVVNQLQNPVVSLGRRRIPRAGVVVTVTVAMGSPSSLELEQEGHQRVDLLLAQSVVGHPRSGLHRGWVGQPASQVRGVHVQDASRETVPAGEVGEVRSAVRLQGLSVRALNPLQRMAGDARSVHEVLLTGGGERAGGRGRGVPWL